MTGALKTSFSTDKNVLDSFTITTGSLPTGAASDTTRQITAELCAQNAILGGYTAFGWNNGDCLLYSNGATCLQSNGIGKGIVSGCH